MDSAAILDRRNNCCRAIIFCWFVGCYCISLEGTLALGLDLCCNNNNNNGVGFLVLILLYYFVVSPQMQQLLTPTGNRGTRNLKTGKSCQIKIVQINNG